MPEASITERDLRPKEATGLGGMEGEILFQHIRTGQELVTIYSMQDGEAISVPEHLVAAAMQKPGQGGGFMFTQNESEAPEYVPGTVLCFLHADSPERESGVLKEIGLSGKFCEKATLGSEDSKHWHGKTRHGREAARLQDYLDRKEKKEDRDRQAQQLEATLAIARDSATQRGEVVRGTSDNLGAETFPCDQCDTEAKSAAGLSAHVRGAHKEA